MLSYLKGSVKRKKARRVTREYPAVIRNFNLEKEGPLQFACWQNPLVSEFCLKQQNVDFFRKFINEGDMVIDIGAHIGDTTVPMGLAAGAGGLALGFDPNPFVFKILEMNASLNRDKTNIVPCQYAVSAAEQEFYFLSSEASFGNGAISLTKKSKQGRYVHPDKVRGVNLMDFLDLNYKHWLGKLTFIKIDAEGYDKEIIKSLSGLLGKYKPVLVAESYGRNSEEEKLELYDVISRHGYKVNSFVDFDVNGTFAPIGSRNDILKWKKTVNLLAVPV